MDTTPDPTTPHDVVVVGGSVAGLSAALVLGRARLRVAVVDAGHPVNEGVAHSHGFLTNDGAPPADLVARGRAEVAAYGVDLVDDAVTGVRRADDGTFVVTRSDGPDLVGRRLVLATGMRVPLPGLPGLDDVWGGDAASCPFCHGWEARDRAIGVLGDPAGVAHLAGLLTQWSDDVVAFLPDGAEGAPPGVVVDHREPTRVIVEDGHLRGVEVAGGDVVAREALFVGAWPGPASSLAADLGCEVDDAGFPVTTDEGLTSVPGVWAVGNAVTMARGLVESAASGSVAARMVVFDVVQERLATPA